VDAPVEQSETTCYRHPERRAGVRCQRCERFICPQCMSTASVGFHCPECARTGRQKVYTRATWSGALHRPVVTQALIAINAVVFFAGLADTSRNAVAGRGGFILDGGLQAFAVSAGDWWRIVTAGFLHAGLLHLLFNMLALFNLGMALEPVLGRVRFLAVYLMSLLSGSLLVLLLSPDALTVGASGAVFGLMGALVVAQRARGIDPWSSGIGTVIGINLLITFTIPGISIGGHVGGLLGGLVAGWLLLEAGPRLRAAWAPLAVVAALAAVTFVGCLVVAEAAA
jgi:membrane associated rhomboid family serine protease